ncbi:hypothetical protein RU98_GL000792 [Enterococcus caccae]|nr:hypothetical protein RU98_GL000792 [Enterococcus caccae]
MFRQVAVVYAQDEVVQTVTNEEEKNETDKTQESSVGIPGVEPTTDEISQADLVEKKGESEEQEVPVGKEDKLENRSYGLVTDCYPELVNADETPKLDYLTGEEIILYSKLGISGSYFPSKQVKFRIVLAKKHFEFFGEVSDAVTFPVAKELSQDDENIYLDITLENIHAGMDLAIPFRVKFRSRELYYGTKVPITQILYDETGEELAKDSLELEAITLNRTITFGYSATPFPVSSEYVDDTGLISSDFIDEVSFYVRERGNLGQNLGESLVEITLQKNMIFKAEDNESEWTYNAEKHSISRKLAASYSAYASFKVRYQNVYVDTSDYPVEFKATVNVLNENGKIEPKLSEENSVKRKKFIAVSAGIISSKVMYWSDSKDRYYTSENKEKEFKTIITASHNGKKGSTFLKKIEDEPTLIEENVPFVLTSIWLNKSEDIKGAERNTVYGITASGEKVKITENLGSEIFTFEQEQAFVSFYIEFETAVELKKSSDNVQLIYNAKRSPAYWEYLKENLKTDHYAYNKAIIHYSDSDGVDTTNTSSHQLMTTKPINKLRLAYVQPKTNVFIGEKFQVEFWSSIEDTTSPKLVDPKLYFILPRGLELASFDYDGDNIMYTEEKNFKGTGKTALIIQPKEEWKLSDFTSIFSWNALKLSLKFNNSAKYGSQDIESYLTYENNDDDGIQMDWYGNKEYYKVTESDPYQLLSPDMDKQGMLGHSNPIRLIPPSSLFIDTAASVDEQQGFINGKTEPVDQGDHFKQKISVMNYSHHDITKLVGIDVLPHAGDFSTTIGADGEHQLRGSDLGYLLEGPVTGPKEYTIYYSYDKPSKSMSENAESATWLKGEKILYNQVTMIKVVLNDGEVLEKNQEAAFTFPVKVPIDEAIANNDKMINTFTVTTNDKSWVESRVSEIPVTAYDIRGLVFNDSNKNSQKDSNERFLAGYEVELAQAGATEPMLTTFTDSNGAYEFTTVPARGDYQVRIKTKEGDIISEYQPSTEDVIATDVTAEAESNDGCAIAALAPDTASHRINMGVYLEKPLGSVELTKLDSVTKQVLAGAEFRIEQEDGSIIETELVTDAKGKILLENFPLGNYQFVETKAPLGYELDNTPVPFELTDTTIVRVTKENTPLLVPPVIVGSIELTKVDTVTKQVLANAIFQLEKEDGTVVQKYLKTNTAGKFVVEHLPVGNYQIIEIAAPSGYVLDQTPIKVELVDATRVKVTKENLAITDLPTLGSVELTKVDRITKQTLSGAEFCLEKADGTILKTKMMTDSNGKIATSLPVGSYRFVETAAPTHYEIDTTPVTFEITTAHEIVQVTKENSKKTELKTNTQNMRDKEVGNHTTKRKLPATGSHEVMRLFNFGYAMLFLFLLLLFSKQVYRRYNNDSLKY